MVLQALQPIVFRLAILSCCTAFLNSYLAATDFSGTSDGVSANCETVTTLDFTEKEACDIVSVTKSFLNMTATTAQLISGTTQAGSQESAKYRQIGSSNYMLRAKLDKAKALLSSKSNVSVQKTSSILLLDAETRKLMSQSLYLYNEDQIILDRYLLKSRKAR